MRPQEAFTSSKLCKLSRLKDVTFSINKLGLCFKSKFQITGQLNMFLHNFVDLSFKSKLVTIMGLDKAASKRNISLESFAQHKDDFIAWCEVRRVSGTKPTCSAR